MDFLRVSRDTRLNVMVPVVFLNEEESPGLKRGGVLNVVRFEIELSCRADAIPPQIEVDLAGRDIGDSAHISEVTLPSGQSSSTTCSQSCRSSACGPSRSRPG